MAGKTIAEQLASLKATREALQASMDGIAQKSIDEGRSMNTAEAEEFDTAEAEIKAIDADVARLTRLEAVKASQATAAAAQAEAIERAPARPTAGDIQLKKVEKLEPGIAFA